MAGRFQLRRGNTAQNNAFTGTVGELTFDTETNGVRVHDGHTQGGLPFNMVTEFQRPTAANNYTWFRVWADGWVEMGGTNVSVNEQSTKAIDLPITMKDTNYTAVAQNNTSSTAADAENGVGIAKTSTTRITLFTHYINPNTISVSWYVCGEKA